MKRGFLWVDWDLVFLTDGSFGSGGLGIGVKFLVMHA